MYVTPGPVGVITRQQIEQRAPRNSSDLFEDMAGVYTTTDRQNPGVTINIRGLQEQGRVNVMIDGARQNFQQAGHNAVSSVYFDPELIGGIVVEKGPTSTVGGAGVIGGVVSLRTLEADDILLPGKTFGTRSRITVGTNEFRYTASERRCPSSGSGRCSGTSCASRRTAARRRCRSGRCPPTSGVHA